MRKLFFLTLILLTFSSPSHALRCGRELIEIGYFTDQVYDICGEPDSIQTHMEVRGVSDYSAFNQNHPPNLQYPNSNLGVGRQYYREVQVEIQEWIYDFGRTRFRQLLRFENGKLVEIRKLGKGR